MYILNTQIALNITTDTKQELITLINKLVEYNLINFIITEDKAVIGSTDNKYQLRSTSTLTNGYVITIYCKSFIILKLLEELEINYIIS